MKVVIQCASSKEPGAGHFRAPDGRRVGFVAHPELAPPDEPPARAARRPRPRRVRDVAGSGRRVRRVPRRQPYGLYPAFRLYSNPCYAALVARFGTGNVLILSAGWGLIRSDFLTPQYDITFSNAAHPSRKRRAGDRYEDFCHLPADADGPVVFFGGKDYLPLFWRLTRAVRAERVVFYNSGVRPQVPGCRLVRYETAMRTNWHYACAADFAAGRIAVA